MIEKLDEQFDEAMRPPTKEHSQKFAQDHLKYKKIRQMVAQLNVLIKTEVSNRTLEKSLDKLILPDSEIIKTVQSSFDEMIKISSKEHDKKLKEDNLQVQRIIEKI